MQHTIQRYEGLDEGDAGFYASAGAIHVFSEQSRIFRFNIEDSDQKLALVEKATIDGAEVLIMLFSPHGNNPAVLKLPLECPVFSSALAELRAIGVLRLAVFNQQSGFYSHVPIGT